MIPARCFTVCIIAVITLSAYLTSVAGQQPPAVNQSAITKSSSTRSISCYQCNSNNVGQKNCEGSDLAQLSKYIKPCAKLNEGTYKESVAKACRKILQDVSDPDRGVATVRECAYTGDTMIEGKRRTGNKGITMKIYQCFTENNEQPCNGSPVFKALAAFIVPLVTILFLL